MYAKEKMAERQRVRGLWREVDDFILQLEGHAPPLRRLTPCSRRRVFGRSYGRARVLAARRLRGGKPHMAHSLRPDTRSLVEKWRARL